MFLYKGFFFLFIPNQLVRAPQIWNQDDDVGNMQIMRLAARPKPTSGENYYDVGLTPNFDGPR